MFFLKEKYSESDVNTYVIVDLRHSCGENSKLRGVLIPQSEVFLIFKEKINNSFRNHIWT